MADGERSGLADRLLELNRRRVAARTGLGKARLGKAQTKKKKRPQAQQVPFVSYPKKQ